MLNLRKRTILEIIAVVGVLGVLSIFVFILHESTHPDVYAEHH